MKAAAAITIALLFGAVGFASYTIATHLERKTITVQSKERLMQVSTTDGKTTTTYRNFVYASDETYAVQDSLWNGHFMSATVYAKMREGATCDVLLSGYRVGFLSMFQNIIEAECRA